MTRGQVSGLVALSSAAFPDAIASSGILAKARTTYRGGSALVFDQLPSRLAAVSPSASVTNARPLFRACPCARQPNAPTLTEAACGVKAPPLARTRRIAKMRAMSDSDKHREKMQSLQKQQRDEVKRRIVDRGVLVVHTGDGKGKSTAGFGVAIRAAGHGQKVGVVQFVKGTWKTGEQAALARFPEIEHVVAGEGFTWDTQDRAKDVAAAERGLAVAERMITSGDYDVVVLDELCFAMSVDHLATDAVLELLRRRPEHVSVVCTGRGAKPELVALADTVTEHVPIKHAWDQGVQARRGVEW